MQLLTLDDQDYIMTKLVTGHQNHDQRHKYHHLTKTLHLTLKMTTAQVVETSVTNNSLSEDYSHPDDHTRQTTDTPGFKPFTNSLSEDYSHPDDHTRQTTDTPGFKPFTNSLSGDYSHPDDHTRQTTDTPGFHLPTVFLKTTLTQTITQDKQLILLGSIYQQSF